MRSESAGRWTYTSSNGIVASCHAPSEAHLAGQRPQFVVLVYPNMSLCDLVSAQSILHLERGDVHLVWKRRSAVMTDLRVAVMPTSTFADYPSEAGLLFVPGSAGGSDACLKDKAVLMFLAECSGRAHYIASTSTGSALLRASGALNGAHRERGEHSRFLLLSVRREGKATGWYG